MGLYTLLYRVISLHSVLMLKQENRRFLSLGISKLSLLSYRSIARLENGVFPYLPVDLLARKHLH